jgi:hypothetical protein
MVEEETFSGRVFVLGAGFSHYLSGGCLPLLRQLSAQVAEEVPWILNYSKSAQEPDLERALTELDLEITAEKRKREASRLKAKRAELTREITRHLCFKGITERHLAYARRRCEPLLRPGDCILTFRGGVSPDF